MYETGWENLIVPLSHPYFGFRIEADPIDCDAIFNLPEYRKKHLLFDYGKELLKIPIRPESIPRFETCGNIFGLIFLVKRTFFCEMNFRLLSWNLSKPRNYATCIKYFSMVTVRRSQIEQTLPWPIDTNHGIDMAKATIFDINRLFMFISIIFQRSSNDKE